jgi:hypothetical protein
LGHLVGKKQVLFTYTEIENQNLGLQTGIAQYQPSQIEKKIDDDSMTSHPACTVATVLPSNVVPTEEPVTIHLTGS